MNKDPKKSRGLVIKRVEEAETLFCLHKAIVIGIMQVNLRSSNIRVTKEHGELIDIPVGIKQVICCERMPMIMYTFLENNDLGGKTIIPFSTHGGSGWGSTLSELKKLCPNSEFKDGFSVAGTNARNTDTETKVTDWIDGLDIINTTIQDN